MIGMFVILGEFFILFSWPGLKADGFRVDGGDPCTLVRVSWS